MNTIYVVVYVKDGKVWDEYKFENKNHAEDSAYLFNHSLWTLDGRHSAHVEERKVAA